MKIILLQAPFYVTEETPSPEDPNACSEPNLGLGDLAAYLIAHGYDDVAINNFNLDSWNAVREHLQLYATLGKNLIVGINCFSDMRQATFKLAQIAKELVPGCTVVIGGVHASILFENILKTNPAIDAVVVGEGEQSFLEVVKRTARGEPLSDSIKGIAFRNSSEIVFTGQPEFIKNLDDLPMTAHHLYDIDALRWNHDFDPSRNTAMRFIPKDFPFTPKLWYMNTSRGCPGNCQFCTGNRFWQGGWRARSPNLVVDEMEYLHRHYGVNLISFFDNCFITNRKRVTGICEELLRRNLKIYWICLTRADNVVDFDILKLMRKAGCLGICYGIESGAPAILKSINKKCDVIQAKNAVQMTKKAGIKVLTFYIVGNYGESDRTIRETIDFVKEVKSDVLSVVYNVVFPGTALYEVAKSRGWLDDSYWDGNDAAPQFTYEHSYEKLATYMNGMLFAHYSSRLIAGDASTLRLYFFTTRFLSYLAQSFKLGWLIGFLKRLRRIREVDRPY